MKVLVTDQFPLPLPPGHRFPVEKYALLRERVQELGLVAADDLVTPRAATKEEILLVHSQGYWDRMASGALTKDEQRALGLPWSPELVERSLRSVGATIVACELALRDGVAVSLAGGTHHAFHERGEGFCVFNDAVVALRSLQARGMIARAVIIDLDVHQGNGTAALCVDDPTIYTFSMHCDSNYPVAKPRSDVDIGLPDRTGDEAYLATLAEALPRVLAAANADVAIYLAGADPYEGDRLGRLSLTKAGLLARDRYVLAQLRARALPVAVTMAGGYAREVRDTVEIQAQTVAVAASLVGPAKTR